MTFKVGDIVKHDCECGDTFCLITLGKPLEIVNIVIDSDDRIVHECFCPKMEKRQDYLEHNLKLVNSELIKKKLGLK